MIENPQVAAILQLVLVVIIAMMVLTSYRIWKGPSIADRLLAIDLLTTLLIAAIVILALITGTAIFIDLGIALAAFGFIGTIAAARYYSEGRVF